MNTCKTCKHWEKENHIPHWTEHRCIILNDHERDEGRADCLVAPDQGLGGIYTGPDFGCIHHEPKPAGE